MSLPKDQAWFSAKKYGYGWGFPKRWQGWIVMFVWLVALVVMIATTAKLHPLALLAFIPISSVVLVGICQWKGEAAKWRWGDRDDEEGNV